MKTNQEPFRKYNLDEEGIKADTFTIKLNKEERKELEEWKHLIQQEKDSTCMKQLARLGAKVLLGDLSKLSNEIVLGNYRKNKRLNIVKFD